MRLEKIQNNAPKVPELVLQSLISAMEDGRIRVGEDLPPERDLAVSLGVGRGSLRECLAILEFLGIIETRGNRKIVNKDVSHFRKAESFIKLSNQSDTTLDVLEFRRVNEVAIVELACERATEEDLALIEASVERLARDLNDYMADVEFHTNVARASHNAMFAVLMELFNSMIAEVRVRYFQLPDYFQRTLNSHRNIYLAIKARDKEWAKEEMSKHIGLVNAFMAEAEGQMEQQTEQ